jgi:ATP-dependent Zn protease
VEEAEEVRQLDNIDCEVRRILDDQSARVRKLLEGRDPVLATAAQQLIELETLRGEELEELLRRSGPELCSVG